MRRFLSRASEGRWGAQMLRIASDMMLVCDEDLAILHHNRAFLKAVGYAQGSFLGTNLADFFPSDEREGVRKVFQDWHRGHAAGMRFQAPLLTTKGQRPSDFRAVRSRDQDRGGIYVYYIVARELPPSEKTPGSADESHERGGAFLRGLPVAAWRTDGQLRITQAFGSLWPEIDAASEDLVGETVGHQDSLLPPVLRGIDFTDALSGMSVQTEVRHGEESYIVTVEPFLDSEGRLVGTVGFLRRSIRCGAVADRFVVPPREGLSTPHHAPPAIACEAATAPVATLRRATDEFG